MTKILTFTKYDKHFFVRYYETVKNEHGNIKVVLPETIEVAGEEVFLEETDRVIWVDPGKNRDHNIRRDVRRHLKNLTKGFIICISYKIQDSSIILVKMD